MDTVYLKITSQFWVITAIDDISVKFEKLLDIKIYDGNFLR